MSRNKQQLKISIGLVADCLWSQIHIAALDIGLDISLQRWLVVLSGYQLASFLYAKVACKRVVVVPAYQLWADDFRSVRKALVMEHLLDVFSALRQSF